MHAFVRSMRWMLVGVLLGGMIVARAQQATTVTTNVTTEVKHVENAVGNGKIDWTAGELRAVGVGLAPRNPKSRAEKIALAREAAIVAAERNLLKVINGVEVMSETTVENLTLTKDIIQTRVSGLLQGAQIIHEHLGENEESYEVVMAVRIYGTKSLSSSIDLPAEIKQMDPEATIIPPAPQTDPAPPPAPIAPQEQPVAAPVTTPVAPATAPEAANTEPYTGLVVDCRGLDLARSMCPRILDQANTNLWGTLTVSAEVVNERGLAGYFTTLDDPALAERVGKHPLVVKSLRVAGGKSVKTDVVVSPADAELIKAANVKTLFLDKLNVAFLVDTDK